MSPRPFDLAAAIELAARAHAGAVDKAGAPYILHPLRVMMSVAEHGEHAMMAAVLHDVVEDTDVTVDDLVALGAPEPVVKAVVALTKLPGAKRIEAAAIAAADPIALRVKLADVSDNMRLERIAAPTEADYARLREYAVVKAFLVAKLG